MTHALSAMHPETLRNWVRRAEIDGGARPGITTDDARRLAELEQENREGSPDADTTVLSGALDRRNLRGKRRA